MKARKIIYVVITILIISFLLSCKAAPIETQESETIAPETTPPETTPITEATISKDEAPKFIAEYTVQSGDTLVKIAKDYYGYNSQPYWCFLQLKIPPYFSRKVPHLT